MEEDRRWSLKELERHTGIDQATVHRILRKDLHMRKIEAKWVHCNVFAQKKLVAMTFEVTHVYLTTPNLNSSHQCSSTGRFKSPIPG
jgi:hypothetical protein